MNSGHKENSKDDVTIDRYLWDGSGSPIPELQRMETLLGQFRHSGGSLVLPHESNSQPAKSRVLISERFRFPRMAAVLLVGLSVAAGAFLTFSPKRHTESGNGWEVEGLEGKVRLGNGYLLTNQTNTMMNVGQALETSSSSHASISEKSFGQIDVEPNSRIQLEQSDDTRARIQLDRGTIRAAIWAPPGQFVVDTPFAVAVDLGCAYTLQVSSDGAGSIRTTLGWVGFHLNGLESFIPAGAICSIRPHLGPGTPYFEDATAGFRDAVVDFDSAAESGQQRAALGRILSEARVKDGLTLWHLLSRTDGLDRGRVYIRFAQLAPPPEGVTREGILRLDQSMMDLWWNSLKLGDISLWRLWEQSSPVRSRLNPTSSENRNSSSHVR